MPRLILESNLSSTSLFQTNRNQFLSMMNHATMAYQFGPLGELEYLNRFVSVEVMSAHLFLCVEKGLRLHAGNFATENLVYCLVIHVLELDFFEMT